MHRIKAKSSGNWGEEKRLRGKMASKPQTIVQNIVRFSPPHFPTHFPPHFHSQLVTAEPNKPHKRRPCDLVSSSFGQQLTATAIRHQKCHRQHHQQQHCLVVFPCFSSCFSNPSPPPRLLFPTPPWLINLPAKNSFERAPFLYSLRSYKVKRFDFRQRQKETDFHLLI